jgi:hypothetical protein
VTQIGNLVLMASALGVVATALLDLWSLGRKTLSGVAPPDYGLVGRWFGYIVKGRLRHDSIAKAAPVPAERLIGWTLHYLIGIAFALVLLGYAGIDWLHDPALMPAMTVGLGSVMAPFLILQPGMGLGVAASRTPRPWVARWRSLINHAVFGATLYVAGWILSVLM